MSRKQSFDVDLSMSARLNYGQKLGRDSYEYKKPYQNFDKFSSQVIEKNLSADTNYTSNSQDFSGIRKLPDSISSIRETFSYNPVSSSRYESEKAQTPTRGKNSRLNDLLSQAMDLKNLKKKQFPSSDTGLSSSVNLTHEIYPKSQNQISYKMYSDVGDSRFNRYGDRDQEIKSYGHIQKGFNGRATTNSFQQQLRKIREEKQRRRAEKLSQPYENNMSSVASSYSNQEKTRQNFTKKNYIEYYSPKIQKSSYLKGVAQLNTLSPPYERRKKETSFQVECESPKPNDIKTLKNTLSTKVIKQTKPKSVLNEKAKIEDFIFGKTLGQGRFGTAYLAFHKSSGGIFAIKKVKKQVIKANKLIDQFILEVKLQSFLTHPFILKIYGIFDDQQHIYLVLQFLQQGTLFNYLKKNKKLTEFDTAEKVKYLAESIKYLQDRGIAHRDIKPQNIIMTNGVCKLADFGWATFCDEERRKTYCGTCDYVAPQILQGQAYDQSVDLWCIGVLAYELMTGKAPFYHYSQKQTRTRIMNVTVTYPEEFSQNLKSFLKGLIQKDPEQRMSIQEVLAHPFLKDVKLQ